MEEVLKTRLKTAVVFGIVVIALLLAGKTGFSILCSIVAVGGIYEYLQITKQNRSIVLMGWLLGALLAFVILSAWTNAEVTPILLGTAILVYIYFVSTLFTGHQLPHNRLALAIALFYPGLSLLLPSFVSAPEVWNMHFWAWSLVLIWISDSGAYLVGRKLGKTKLFERISPKKTWEGFLGAGLFTLAGGAMISLIQKEQELTFWLVTAFVVWVMGTLGDLFESSIKRRFEVKDSGTILPGHGGFLDRFDSLIVVIPYLCALLWFKHLIL